MIDLSKSAARRRGLVRATVAIVFLLTAVRLDAHDMFWRLTSYFVAPGAPVQMPVLNGTFSKSENAIEWSRVADVSVVSPDGRATIDSAHWDTRGDTSRLSYTTGKSGTYVVGLSTKPREFQLEAKAFNGYLADDGIPDILALRKKNGTIVKPARERYHKHIKAIFQVGDSRSEAWSTVLGYPAEIIPLSNPYAVKVGTMVAFRCLVDGKPVANQLVQVGGRAGSTSDTRLAVQSMRSDRDGIVHIKLHRAGRWYVKFIRMVPVTDGKVDYESKWATLTFEIR